MLHTPVITLKLNTNIDICSLKGFTSRVQYKEKFHDDIFILSFNVIRKLEKHGFDIMDFNWHFRFSVAR